MYVLLFLCHQNRRFSKSVKSILLYITCLKVYYYSVTDYLSMSRNLSLKLFHFILKGRKRRGSRPSIYVKASSSVCRHVVQTLEKLKIIEEDPDNG